MYTSTNGIGLLVIRDLTQLPTKQDGRGLVLQVDEDNVPIKLYYHDVLGRTELDPDAFDMRELENLAREKEVHLSSINPSLLYLSPNEINSTLNVQADAIRDEWQIAPEYLRRHPQEDKLSRKVSGLENSYVRDKDNEIIVLESKDECRVIWQDNPPSANVFKNLPVNTSAAYVVVRSQEAGKYDVYYIENKERSTPERVETLADPRAFRPFYLRNMAASKNDLESIANDTRHVHKNQATNVLGSGAFGRVKKSRFMHDDSRRVTKAQVLPKRTAVKSKLDNRDARIKSTQQEARTSADVHGGSDKVSVVGDKAYMHMQELGEPLTSVIPGLDREAKIDITIKFLSAVAALHRGDTKTRTRYAHRDIKPPNALYDRETGEVNLVDFGFSTSNIVDKSEINAGTLFYAPLDQSVINEHLRRTNPNGIVAKNESSAASVYEVEELDDDFWEDSEELESVHDLADDSGFSAVKTAESGRTSSGSGIYIAPGKNLDWQNKLADEQLCLTENYLEDDKVASLRTVSCSPDPVKPGTVTSIFTAEEFASFPEPIREVFDATTVAPLLTEERRSETLDFFAAVMISYQANPNLSDREYREMINDLRQSAVLQVQLQGQYKHRDDVEEMSLDGNYSTDMDEALGLEDTRYSQDDSAADTDVENRDDTPLQFSQKVKPVTEDDLSQPAAGKYRDKPEGGSKKGFFRSITNYFKKKTSTVSPTTTDELSDADEETEETEDRSTTPRN